MPKTKKAPEAIRIKAMSFQDVLNNLQERMKNPPPPLTPEKQEEVNKLLAELRGPGFMELAFSDETFVCKNCGHEYVGERLCPECGA